MSSEEIRKTRDRCISHLRGVFGDDTETIIAEKRYGFIGGLLKETLKRFDLMMMIQKDSLMETPKHLDLPKKISMVIHLWSPLFLMGIMDLALLTTVIRALHTHRISILPVRILLDM